MFTKYDLKLKTSQKSHINIKLVYCAKNPESTSKIKVKNRKRRKKNLQFSNLKQVSDRDGERIWGKACPHCRKRK